MDEEFNIRFSAPRLDGDVLKKRHLFRPFLRVGEFEEGASGDDDRSPDALGFIGNNGPIISGPVATLLNKQCSEFFCRDVRNPIDSDEDFAIVVVSSQDQAIFEGPACFPG